METRPTCNSQLQGMAFGVRLHDTSRLVVPTYDARSAPLCVPAHGVGQARRHLGRARAMAEVDVVRDRPRRVARKRRRSRASFEAKCHRGNALGPCGLSEPSNLAWRQDQGSVVGRDAVGFKREPLPWPLAHRNNAPPRRDVLGSRWHRCPPERHREGTPAVRHMLAVHWS